MDIRRPTFLMGLVIACFGFNRDVLGDAAEDGSEKLGRLELLGGNYRIA